MAAVIDLTAEEEQPQPEYALRHPPIQYPRYHRPPPVASTSNATNTTTGRRAIELGDSDDEDEVVFVRREGLQLPAQGYSNGRDNSNGYNRLRQHARTGDDGIFSRGAASAGSSNNINVIQEDPLRFNRAVAPVGRATRSGTRHNPGNGNGTGRYSAQPPPADLHRPRPIPSVQRHYHYPHRPAGGGGFHYQQEDAGNILEDEEGNYFVPVEGAPRPPRGGRQAQARAGGGGGRFAGIFPAGNGGHDPVQAQAQAQGQGQGQPGDLYRELVQDALQREREAAREAAGAAGPNPHFLDAFRQFFPAGGGFNAMRANFGAFFGGNAFGGFGGFGGGGAGGNHHVHLGEGMTYGPGGTINVKRKVKNYSVRQSHPGFDKRRCKGFERDVVAPPEVEEETNEAEEAKEVNEVSQVQAVMGEGQTDSDVERVASNKDSSETSSTRDKGKGKAKAERHDDDLYLPPPLVKNGDMSLLDLDDPSAYSSSSSIFFGQTGESTQASSFGSTTNKTPASPLLATMTLPVPPPPPAPIKTRKILAPICASCLSPLFLNQPSKRRPFLLICGHVVCSSCIRLAKQRVEEWYERDQLLDVEVPDPEGRKWKGTDVGERFEVVEPVTKGKRKRGPGNGEKGKGKGKGKATTGGRGKKGTGKGKHRDEEEWIPVPDADEEEEEENSSSSDSSDSDADGPTVAPSRKRAKVGEGSLAAAGPSRASKRIRESDLQRVDFRESDEDGVEEEEDDDLMNDGPRQPQYKGKGKGRAGPSTSTLSTVPAHLSIPLNHNNNEAKGKSTAGKGKKAQDPNLDEKGVAKVNKEWLSCPVMGCGGDTDLLSDLGSKKGAWEMFV